MNRGVVFPDWLSAEKLKAVGFDIEDSVGLQAASERRKRPISKEVFVVLEQNGTAYEGAVKRAESAVEEAKSQFQLKSEDKDVREDFEQAKERLEEERVSASRLFAIDAGLDADHLREKYSDRTRFIITRARVAPAYNYIDRAKKPVGYISGVSVENVHVPLELRKLLDDIMTRGASRSSELKNSHYSVELVYGKRLEPWIRSVGPEAE